ncbi:MAG: PAS domain-containing protein [Anaerolineales bacterium]|nr:PAS domain-containing protein [Anaerolineales bacterium]
MSPARSSIPALTPALAGALIRSIPEGILVVDAAGRVVFCNQGAEGITGWADGSACGEALERVLPLVGGGSFLDRSGPNGSLSSLDVVRRDGQALTLAVSRTALDPRGGASARTVLVLRDVTESDAAQRLRSYFLANISHEFRTPLSALKASVELLLEDFEQFSPAETLALLKSVHFSVTGLQTLIDNLLESVSIEAGRFQIRRRPTDLNVLVQEAARVMKPLLERRSQELRLRLPEHLPRVSLDPMRLTQVLVNLLSNASKYSPMDRPIDLDLTLTQDGLKVAVSDRGQGIPEEERANIFRRFIRLDDAQRAQYGVGLGLALVKAIVEEHDGVVGLDARPGGGSIFWFRIPLQEELG